MGTALMLQAPMRGAIRQLVTRTDQATSNHHLQRIRTLPDTPLLHRLILTVPSVTRNRARPSHTQQLSTHLQLMKQHNTHRQCPMMQLSTLHQLLTKQLNTPSQ